jgi:hypothetical protein
LSQTHKKKGGKKPHYKSTSARKPIGNINVVVFFRGKKKKKKKKREKKIPEGERHS